MKYKEGDMVCTATQSRKVLGVCGLVYILSTEDNSEVADMVCTEQQLDKYGCTLDNPEAKIMQEIGEKEKELDELYTKHRGMVGEGE